MQHAGLPKPFERVYEADTYLFFQTTGALGFTATWSQALAVCELYNATVPSIHNIGVRVLRAAEHNSALCSALVTEFRWAVTAVCCHKANKQPLHVPRHIREHIVC
jgi:hypothetical protein